MTALFRTERFPFPLRRTPIASRNPVFPIHTAPIFATSRDDVGSDFTHNKSGIEKPSKPPLFCRLAKPKSASILGLLAVWGDARQSLAAAALCQAGICEMSQATGASNKQRSHPKMNKTKSLAIFNPWRQELSIGSQATKQSRTSRASARLGLSQRN
jgi:hypothetical protein